jgi:hypothetical protein
MGRRSGLGLLVLAALGASWLVPAGGAQAAEPGVVVPLNTDVNTTVQRVQASGARNARIFLSWRLLATLPGGFGGPTLPGYDDVVNRLRASGISTYFVVVQTPTWATPSGAAEAPPPPVPFAAFLGQLAAHFRGRVLGYEIWNEPDFTTFWAGGASPDVYANLLRAAYPAVKAADPAAKVGVGGLLGNDYTYLDQLYRQGAGGSFDFVGVHTDESCITDDPRVRRRDVDGRISRWSFTGYREVRQTMLDHGDDKPIWMTELGWSTAGGRCPGNPALPAGVSEAEQASFLTRAYACLAADTYVQVGTWFSLSDFGTAPTVSNRFGLLRSNGSARPAFAAFQRARRVAPDSSCGAPIDRTGPRIRVYAPKDGQRRARSLFYRAVAGDSAGVRRLALIVDGHLVRVTGRRWLRGTLRSTWRRLPYGPHRVSFRAVDAARNVSLRTVTVTKVR